MQCQKVRRTLWYHMQSKHSSPEKFSYHVCSSNLCKSLLSAQRWNRIVIKSSTNISNKAPRAHGLLVQDVVNQNKMKFDPYHDLVDQTFLQFNDNLINNQDPQNQIENKEKLGAKYPKESDSEERETNKTFALLNFMPQLLPDGEIVKGINSLNQKQREVFDVVHTWAKIIQNMMTIMLNQSTYFFQVEEARQISFG